MADKPFSGLPAAGSVTGPDLFAVVQGGVTKKGTVSMILDALSGTTAVGAVALADLVPVNQGGTTKKATGQQLFDALALLANQGGVSTGDLLPLLQAGVAKKLTVNDLLATILSSIPSATSGQKGFMAASDKAVLDGATSLYSAGSLAKYSSAGGLRPNGVQLCDDTSGAVIRNLAFKPITATLTGGGTNETFDRNIAAYGFGTTPNFALFWSWFAGTYAIHGGFIGWSTSNLRFNVRRYDGAVLSAGTFSCDCLFGYIENPPV